MNENVQQAEFPKAKAATAPTKPPKISEQIAAAELATRGRNAPTPPGELTVEERAEHPDITVAKDVQKGHFVSARVRILGKNREVLFSESVQYIASEALKSATPCEEVPGCHRFLRHKLMPKKS